jgi:hypothetical protein
MIAAIASDKSGFYEQVTGVKVVLCLFLPRAFAFVVG